MDDRTQKAAESLSNRPGRRFRTRAEIQSILDDYRQSGLSQRKFCDVRGLSASTLQSWIRRLRDEKKGESKPKTPTLIPVRVAPSPKPRCVPLEIILSNDRVIRVQGDFDPDLLAKVIAVAESSPC